DRVREEGDPRRVARDPSPVLDDGGAALVDRVEQLAGTIVPVHAGADAVAGLEVILARLPHGAAGHRFADRRALQRHHGLPDVEAERGVEAERPVVIGSLEQPDAGAPLAARPLQRGEHEPRPNGELTLTISANREVREDLERHLAALSTAASGPEVCNAEVLCLDTISWTAVLLASAQPPASARSRSPRGRTETTTYKEGI